MAPLAIPWMSPPSPVATCSISLGPGNEVKTISALRAAAAGLSAHVAPPDRWGSAWALRTSKTVRVWPFLMRLSAIGPPMLPNPMNPIFIVVLQKRWGHAPLRGEVACPDGKNDAVVSSAPLKHWG